MRIAIFPGGDENRASSRIRAFTLANALRAAGHDARLDDATAAEVLLIQKRASARTLEIASNARRNGAFIVYDADDLGTALWWFVAPRTLHRLLPLVDLITTDTQPHADALRQDFGFDDVEVVPDAIDYYPAGSSRPAPAPETPLRIAWFGDANNFGLFSRYANTLRAIPRSEVMVVTNPDAIDALGARFAGISFLPWSRETFPGILQRAAIALLTHDGTELDRAKSNNRMITSITLGVPVVASQTPEYERTAQECGVEYAIFRDHDECVMAIERLRTVASRQAYLDVAQPQVWTRYSPAAVAQRFVDVVSGARKGAQHQHTSYLRWLLHASRGKVIPALRSDARHALEPWLDRAKR
jgi:hypothetical protein